MTSLLELAEALDAYERRQGRDARLCAFRHELAADFARDYYRTRDQVIEPVLRHVGNALRERGHLALIVEDEPVPAARWRGPAVSLVVIPRERTGDARWFAARPRISFVGDARGRRVLVRTWQILATGGVARQRVERPLDALTRADIERDVVAFVTALLDDGGS